jgi:hypothetical protein
MLLNSQIQHVLVFHSITRLYIQLMILSIKSLYVLEHVGSLSISTCYRHDKAEEVSFGVKLQPRTYFASSSFPSKIP